MDIVDVDVRSKENEVCCPLKKSKGFYGLMLISFIPRLGRFIVTVMKTRKPFLIIRQLSKLAFHYLQSQPFTPEELAAILVALEVGCRLARGIREMYHVICS